MRIAQSTRLLHAFGVRANPFLFYSSIEVLDMHIASNPRQTVVHNVKFLVSMALWYLSINQIHQVRNLEEIPLMHPYRDTPQHLLVLRSIFVFGNTFPIVRPCLMMQLVDGNERCVVEVADPRSFVGSW